MFWACFFLSQQRGEFRERFEECCQWTHLTDNGGYNCARGCVHVCMKAWTASLPETVCIQNLWHPVTVAFLLLTVKSFCSFFYFKKTVTTEATSFFLDLVLVTRMIMNIYFYISKIIKIILRYFVWIFHS